MDSNIFNNGLPPNLVPNPPSEMPAAQEAGNAVSALAPFSEPQDVDAIIKNLVLDRPLKLFIPKQHMHPEYEYRIINSIPQEIAQAQNKGFREVTNPDAVALFDSLVAGTDKTGKAYRPMLVARPKAVGNHVRKQTRAQLASLYAGMDPKNKELNGKYTENVVSGQDASKANFHGDGWRIKV